MRLKTIAIVLTSILVPGSFTWANEDSLQATLSRLALNPSSSTAATSSPTPIVNINNNTNNAPTATSPMALPEKEKQLWNLQDADIRAVIDAISRATGRNFIVDPRVSGKVTIVSSKPIDADEAYQVFLSTLQVLGFTAIPSGDITKIVPITSARSMNSPIANSLNPGQGDEPVVRVIILKNVSATQLVPILRPLVPDAGVINAYTPTNSLVIAGEANNVNRIADIAMDMDQQGASPIQMVPLRHASANKVVSALNTIQSTNSAQGKINNLSIAADTQSNSVLISGNPVDQMRIRNLIDEIDRKSASTGGGTRVFYLNYLKAKEFAPVLSKIAKGQMTIESAAASTKNANNSTSSNAADNSNDTGPENGVSIQAEPSSNAIVVSAPPGLMANLASVIHQLDVPPQQVLVEAVIAQVDDNQSKKLGILWGSINEAQDNINNLTSPATSTGNASNFNLGVGFIKSGSLRVIISALSSNSSSDILSTPSVVVLDNRKAVIEVGKSISIENRNYAGTTTTTDNTLIPFTTLERQNVSLKLTVTPQISPNNTVTLKLDQRNDTLQNPDDPTTTPVINTSDINTTVTVKSGDILVLGGLISHELNNTYTKIPILGDIPGLGYIFRYKEKRLEKKNLLVFLRPCILNSYNEKEIVDSRYNYMRETQIERARNSSLVETKEGPPILPPLNPPQTYIPAPFPKEPG